MSLEEGLNKTMASLVLQMNSMSDGNVNQGTMNKFMFFSQMRIIELLEQIAAKEPERARMDLTQNKRKVR